VPAGTPGKTPATGAASAAPARHGCYADV